MVGVALIAAVAAVAVTLSTLGSSSPERCRSSLPLGGAGRPDAVRTWALIGDGTNMTRRERTAGIDAKVMLLSWALAEPRDGIFSDAYLTAKLREACRFERAGMRVILDWGIQYTPRWINALPNSFPVDQYGERWTAATDSAQPTGDADADLVFDPVLRRLAARYIEVVAARFGSHVAAIRIGGGRDNELAYPSSSTPLHRNTYWAYSYWAQLHCPVPGWKPGESSTRGQARIFLSWYVASLTAYERWQESTLGRVYRGPMIILFPSWGLRPGQFDQAVDDDLDGGTPAELNGETQQGLDFAAEVAAIDRPRVWVETTWGDAGAGGDGGDALPSSAGWTPIHYLHLLLRRQPEHPQLWSENTGAGTEMDLRFAVSQATRFGSSGFVWYDESQLSEPGYATLADLGAAIHEAR